MDNFLTIQHLIECHAEYTPKHIAVIEGGHRYSYQDINQLANQLAHYLLTFSPQPESIIAIAHDRSAELLAAMLAVLKIGCAYLPLDAKNPKQRLQHFIKDSHAPIIITESQYSAQFADSDAAIIYLDQINLNDYPCVNVAVPVNPTQLAYVIYTSGSTGLPKGVLLEHRSAVNYLHWLKQYSGSHQQDIIEFSANINFDMAVTSSIAALALGMQIVITPDTIKQNPRKYLHHLLKANVNIIKITPGYFKILIKEATHSRPHLAALQRLIIGGEILAKKDCEAWLAIYPEHIIHNEYGPTEATVAATQFTVTKANLHQLDIHVPIGKPGLNITCTLKNDELLLGGACLARGYLNQPALTAERFTEYYRTGDHCVLLASGDYECVGRIDEQVKINGYRVEPGEVTACLLTHPAIKEAVVLAHEQQLVAYYLSDDARLAEKSLRTHLQLHLADYMIPAYFIKVTQFPLNANGKLDKPKLPKPALAGPAQTANSDTEQQLISIWQDAFQRDDIGINSHFFALGGHSLIAAKITMDIQLLLNKHLLVTEIYRAPTISELKDSVDAAPFINTHLPTASEDHTTIPLSDFQFMIWLSNLFEPKVKKLNIVTHKRFIGHIDSKALHAAVNDVINKHDIFLYEIGKYSPKQTKREQADIWFIESDLTHLTPAATELQLKESLQQLYTTRWQKGYSSILIKLFHLGNQSEVQIAVPHIIFDDSSLDILLNELSAAYLARIKRLPVSNNHARYSDYVWFERHFLNKQLESDIRFWEDHWQDTRLLTLPQSDIIKDMRQQSFSTYLEFPENTLKYLQQQCSLLSVTMTDLLTAAINLSLKEVASHLNDHILINAVKSNRHGQVDHLIGCMLQLNPIKINLKTDLAFQPLANAIHTHRVATEPHQNCSGMVKLACLDQSFHKKYLRNWVIDGISHLYCSLFPDLAINPKMLAMYGRLSALRNDFLVNVNILNNFIMPNPKLEWFGLPLASNNLAKKDLLQINHVLDISFLRDDFNKPYLIVSGNLKESLRKKIGENIINHSHQPVFGDLHSQPSLRAKRSNPEILV